MGGRITIVFHLLSTLHLLSPSLSPLPSSLFTFSLLFFPLPSPPPLLPPPLPLQLTLSYNKLQVLSLQYLCLPSLEKLNISHNQIHTIQDDRKVSHAHSHTTFSRPLKSKRSLPATQPRLFLHATPPSHTPFPAQVLERITHLSLSHNRLGSLAGIAAFAGVLVMNLSFNIISAGDDLSKLVQLRKLNMLSMTGGCGC